MDDRALLGLGLTADNQAQQRAAQYFEELKESSNGWQMCMNALVTNSYAGNDHVRFFCFQVIEHYLKTRYVGASVTEQLQVRSYLMSWIRDLINGVVEEKSFILNKAAQAFMLVCLCDYPRRWPSLFNELTEALSLGTAVVDVYLRILLAVDSEVVDRDIAHMPSDVQRNTLIKDSIRHNSILSLVNSWYHILVNYESSKPALVCMCLEVIGAYVSWIDIDLIANDRFVSILLQFMSRPLLRESTCDCIYEIISKGMDPVAKTKLIESFTSVLSSAGLLNVKQQEEDGDYLAKLAKLVNGMGLQLILSWQKLIKCQDTKNAELTLDSLESKMSFILTFLSNDDDDVSGTIAPFTHDYVTLLKQLLPLNDKQKTFVQEILYIIIKKMKYDSSYSVELEGEDEAMFQEYRKELRVIFNNLGALNNELILSTVHELVMQTLPRWQVTEYQDVEVAITLLYQLGEALPASNSQHFSGDPMKVTALHDMMKLLLTSRVSCYHHPIVVLQFFETVVRYEKFFTLQPQYIPDVLTAFMDERGLWNTSLHVRSRSSYLFSRFVKGISKSQLQPYLEDMMERLRGLLVVNSPFNGVKQHLSPEDQQFLYETASILIVHSNFPPQKKREMMHKLLAPIVTKFNELLHLLLNENDNSRQIAYAVCLTEAMGFASRTSKGFSNQQTVRQNDCIEVYTDTLKVFLSALGVPVQRQILHQGVRQFLHRMVVCLEADILPFIPIAMDNLLKYADLKQMYDFIPFINQVVQKFKADIVPFLQEVFMPIVSTIFQALTTSVDERDQVTQGDRRLLQRGYFTFISTVVTNNVAQVLSNQSPQSLHQVLMTIIYGAVDIPDPMSQKICFQILKKLIEIWGDKNGLNGFEDFMYKNIIPACFIAPMKSTFDLSDAQTVLVLNESAACLKAAHEKRGDEFIQFLQNNYLQTLNISHPISQELCQALQSNNKTFQTYYKAFFIQARS